MFRKLISLLIAVSFLLIGIADFTIAAERPTTKQPSTTVVKPAISQPVFTCPSGWHRKPNSTDFACVVDTPTPLPCATLGEDVSYLGWTQCQSFSSVCKGCFVGCKRKDDILIFVLPLHCPSGWHFDHVPGCVYCTGCVPNSPTPINCPAGYSYYEMLQCKPGLGTQCVGCEVGCAKPQEPPK